MSFIQQFECEYGVVEFQETPWNTKNLGLLSLDIKKVIPKGLNGIGLLNSFCSYQKNEGFKIITLRIDSVERAMKEWLYFVGFICVEHTLDVKLYSPDVTSLKTIIDRFPVEITDFKLDDTDIIKNMSGEVFRYGRFFEDPMIDEVLAIQRQTKWVDDLIDENAIIRILKSKVNYAGFMAYTFSEEQAVLNLGGVRKGFRHLSYGFWARILLELADSKCITTTISSSNTDIINLYSHFNFQFANPKFGYHKYL